MCSEQLLSPLHVAQAWEMNQVPEEHLCQSAVPACQHVTRACLDNCRTEESAICIQAAHLQWQQSQSCLGSMHAPMVCAGNMLHEPWLMLLVTAGATGSR